MRRATVLGKGGVSKGVFRLPGFPNEGMVVTAEGPVVADQVGIALTHEHIFPDNLCHLMPPRTERQREIAEQPLSMDILGEARRDPLVFRDVLVQNDEELAALELADAKRFGAKTIVDVTPKGNGRDVKKIPRLVDETDLQIVVACGYYVESSHPSEVADKDVGELTELLLSEIVEGIDGTDIRPGIIGEIGMSQPVHPDEWKALTAACEAQKQTGLPLSVHPHFGSGSRIAPEVVKHILRQGVNPERVNVCHIDGYMNPQYQMRVADMGVYISFDTFGLEVYYDSLDYTHNCHDSERERLFVNLLDHGYEEQLLLSQDVCTKLQLRKYGGYGYGHLLSHIVPSLRRKGVDDRTLDRILVGNTRRFLTIA